MNKNTIAKTIGIKRNGVIKFYLIEDIIYMEGRGDNTLIYFKDCDEQGIRFGKHLLYYQRLLEANGFVRINRQQVVNPAFYSEYVIKTRVLTMRIPIKNKLVVSKEYRTNFLKSYHL